MIESWNVDVIWWITAVELPTLAALFWLSWRNRRDADRAIEHNRWTFEAKLAGLRENLAAYKLEVAQSYASIGYLKEVERRLTDHLVRIEDKLDAAGHAHPRAHQVHPGALP